jgi:hypothetical protein
VLFPVAIATGLAVLSESFQALVFNRSIDVSLLIAGMVIAMLGALSGQIFSPGGPTATASEDFPTHEANH